jgi:hypothetical protein
MVQSASGNGPFIIVQVFGHPEIEQHRRRFAVLNLHQNVSRVRVGVEEPVAVNLLRVRL